MADSTGKAANQRAHILDGTEPSSNTEHHAVCLRLEPNTVQVCLPVHGRLYGRKLHAVIDRKHGLWVKAPGNQQLSHGIGNADMVGNFPNADGIDGTIGQMVDGTSQVVQAIVRMNGGHHRRLNLTPQQGTDQVGTGTVTMDHLIASGVDLPRQDRRHPQHIFIGINNGLNTQFPGLLGKGAFHKADKTDFFRLAQPL